MAIITRTARNAGGTASAELVDVQAAYSGTGFWADGHDGKPVVNGAAPLQDGDTLVMGAGNNVPWPTPFTISTAIKVLGQGINTSITSAAGAFIINLTPQPAGAGFNTWVGGMIVTNTTKDLGKPIVTLNGNNFDSPHRGFRVHHMRFLCPIGGFAFSFGSNDGAVGVVDHCCFLDADLPNTNEMFIARHDAVPATIGDPDSHWGHGSWARGRNLQKMIYFEDCVYGHQIDAYAGARVTVRHCSSDKVGGQGQITHGLESSGDKRSTYTQDVYNCHFNNPPGKNALFVGFRGGNGRVFNNDGTGNYSSGARKTLQLFNYRMGQHVIKEWRSAVLGNGAADGTCVFDTNDRAAHGSINPVGRICQPNSDIFTHITNAPCLPDPNDSTAKWQGAVYASMTYDGANTGTIGFGINVSFPHTAQFPATPLNFWASFCLRNVTFQAPFGAAPVNHNFVYIDGSVDLGNGRTQLTLLTQGIAIVNPTTTLFRINNGDQCEIRRVIKAIDCTCAGGGGEITGNNTGQRLAAGGVGPLNQTSEKIHYWGNRNRPNDTTGFTSITYNQVDWAMAIGPVGSLSQITCSATDPTADICLFPSTDINWDAGTSNTPANLVGADDGVRATFFPSAGQDTIYYGAQSRAGSGGAEYPHWIVRDALPGGIVTQPPAITNTQTAFTFTKGATASCTNPKVNCFTVTTANFTGTPTLTVLSGSLPTNVAISGLNITGTAASAAVGPYDFVIRATSGAEVDDKAFHIDVITTSVPPTNVNVTNPLTGATFVAPATIRLESTATTSGGATLSTMQYYYGVSNLITTVDATTTVSPYGYNWTGVAAGTYSLTVKATDSQSQATTSSAISVTVVASPTLQPPTIVVSG